MKKILVAVTNVSTYPKIKKATGVWFQEVVHFVDKLVKEGYEIDYVSPLGGNSPIDPTCLVKEQMTDLDWTYYNNPTFLNKLGNTLAAKDINPDDYQAIYFAGGHGVMWDFANDSTLQAIASTIYKNGGVVSAVCHGVVGLLHIKNEENNLLIKDRKVTGFANTEEKAIGLDEAVPFLTEEALKKAGATYVKTTDWNEYAIADGRVVTGQNPASGSAVAKEVLNLINL